MLIEGQTTQWPRKKHQKHKQRYTNHAYKTRTSWTWYRHIEVYTPYTCATEMLLHIKWKLIGFHGEKGNQNYIKFILRTLFELEEKTAWKKSIFRFSPLNTLFVLLLHRLSWQQTELKLLFIVWTLFFMTKKK
jgi:hypothetical protein